MGGDSGCWLIWANMIKVKRNWKLEQCEIDGEIIHQLLSLYFIIYLFFVFHTLVLIWNNGTVHATVETRSVLSSCSTFCCINCDLHLYCRWKFSLISPVASIIIAYLMTQWLCATLCRGGDAAHRALTGYFRKWCVNNCLDLKHLTQSGSCCDIAHCVCICTISDALTYSKQVW